MKYKELASGDKDCTKIYTIIINCWRKSENGVIKKQNKTKQNQKKKKKKPNKQNKTKQKQKQKQKTKNKKQTKKQNKTKQKQKQSIAQYENPSLSHLPTRTGKQKRSRKIH